jgi:hypothetical protein
MSKAKSAELNRLWNAVILNRRQANLATTRRAIKACDQAMQEAYGRYRSSYNLAKVA